MKVGFISLGCSKNLVDTEMMIGLFKKNDFEIVNNEEQAEILVINTCGFITSAKEEAINTILEMIKYKENGTCKYIIVMGCLVQRYKKELEKEIPEIDLLLTVDEYDTAWEKICTLLEQKVDNQKLNYHNRVLTTGDTTAYLKIAEGCSNFCTYCAIPKIRGPFKSRPMEDVIKEAEGLAKKGIKELIVIAQDTSKYGVDIYGKYKLAELLQKLCEIDGFVWIRFLYTYPESITDELLKTVKENDKICNYFDIPIQHISDPILKKMNRKSNKQSIINLIEKIRKEIPNAIMRTSIIVGFPGEREEDFNELYDFVSMAKFERMGAFTYSKEDGTPAAKFENQVHYKTKKSRYDKLMKLQKSIANETLKKHIGKQYKALIEGETTNGKYYIARTYMDTPDVDGVIYIKKEETPDNLNKFVDCTIIEQKGYDLIAKIN